MVKVRIPGRAIIYIEGTQAYQRPLNADDQLDHELFHRIVDTPARKDGSRMVELDGEDRVALLDYASAWILGARDNAGPDDMDALADYRSLSSLIRHLESR